jgi:hypothetical protein
VGERADRAREPLSERAEIQLLVPIHHEGENVAILHRRLAEERVGYDSLTFVYDEDGDVSLPFVETIRRSDPRVRAEKNQLGPGVLRALRFGFSRCRPGPVVVVMGDNSDKLSLVPAMVRLWREGAVVVTPSRYMPGGRQHGGGWLKSRLSRWAGRSLRLAGFPTSDPTNNFKLYDGEWLRRQRIESDGGFEVALELCYKAFVQGERIAELPTEWWDRARGKSRFRLAAWLPRYLRWYLRSLVALARGSPRLRA